MSESPVPAPSCLAGRRLTLATCVTAGAGLVANLAHHSGLLSVSAVGCLALLVAALVVQRREARQIARLHAGWERAAQLAELSTSIIGAFAMAIDAKEQHTQGHTERVRDIAVLIAKELGLSQGELDALSMAAMLQDIGTLAVPDYILSRPDRLTEEEKKKVQTHVLVGTALLESARFPWPVVPIIRGHHEWYDGSGYPDGLSGEAIPLGARILAVADVYGSLLSRRPYRAALPAQEAVEFLRQHAGSQFDPDVLGACLEALEATQPAGRPVFVYTAGEEAPPPPETANPEPTQVYQHIQQANQEMLALYEMVQTVGRSLDVRETLELVISKTRKTTAANTCVLFLRQDEDSLVAAAASGAFADRIEGQRLPLGRGLSGTVAQTGLPCGPHRLAREDLDLLAGDSTWAHRLAHALSAPLVNDLGSIGALTLYRATEEPFSEDDARLIAAVAKQAAVAVTNAREYEQTRQSALTDGLTGLANARCFHMRLEQELGRARQEKRPLSLIAIDLDGLKYVNDTYGHQEGDRVLCAVGEVFTRHARDVDTVVRYAGDEFFIILPGLPNREAWEMQHRLKAAVRATLVEVTPGTSITLSASFGAATFPGDAQQAEALIAVADAAMYADKRLGRQAALLRASADRTDARPVGSVGVATSEPSAGAPAEPEGDDG